MHRFEGHFLPQSFGHIPAGLALSVVAIDHDHICRVPYLQQVGQKFVPLVLLSIGIFLGGLWGKQAWGRFWGWDPKETWARITLLVYAALLSGHKARWWCTRGLAAGSIVAFQCVIFTWYGLNFFGGNSLHSYGWSGGGLGGIIGFAVVECVFLGVTLSRKPR